MNTENTNHSEPLENENVPAPEATNSANESMESMESNQEENQSEETNGESQEQEQAAQEDWKNKYYYLAADFDNFRRNQAKERRELLATAAQGVIKDMLPILDNFERAIKANENLEDIAAIKEGFNLIHLGLKNGLEKHGLKAIDSNGEVFNSDMHEAIAQIPSPSEDLKGKVLDTVEKGYSLNDKVIRYAKVAVGS
jgi:molecular chaperone GrpE